MSLALNVASQATVKTALRPDLKAAASSFSLTGTSIDRVSGGFSSVLLAVFAGALSGTPDSFSVNAKLQESDDDSTFTDVVADGINEAVTITAITAINTQAFLTADLTRLKRYTRLAFTVAFVGGTTPKVGLSAVAVLGGGVSLPPTHA